MSSNSPELVAEFLNELEANPDVRESAGLGALDVAQLDEYLSAMTANAPNVIGVSRLGVNSDHGLPLSAKAMASAATSYPVIGGRVNGGWSWRYADRYTYVTCALGPLFCTTKGTLDIRMTTNPGKTGSKTDLNFLLQGTGINSVKIRSRVYGNGSLVSDVTQSWSIPGYGSQINSPHSSLLSKSFRATYEVSIVRSGGTDTGTYATATSSKCLQPNGAAFRCLFP